MSSFPIFDRPPALVVGICGHGLAICRGLCEGNVPVIAIESNRNLPGVHTKQAIMDFVDDINGEDLIQALLAVRQKIICPDLPVLFLTNDKMVRMVATHWNRLRNSYRLSWSHCRNMINNYLDKSILETHCRENNLYYPRTCILNSIEDIDSAVSSLGFPIIVKPSRPLSQFKTSQPRSSKELYDLFIRYKVDLPFLIQQFVLGGDQSIFFCALYLDNGKVLARFDGHKLRSRPLGHTTLAESLPNNYVYEASIQFFDNLKLSGPVSLELKRDSSDRLWVIEPTVGRTDFWIGLCIANGVNIPLIEYYHQIGANLPVCRQENNAIWINEDRDPMGRIWLLTQAKVVKRNGRKIVYIYLHARDMIPAIRAILEIIARFWLSMGRMLSKIYKFMFG